MKFRYDLLFTCEKCYGFLQMFEKKKKSPIKKCDIFILTNNDHLYQLGFFFQPSIQTVLTKLVLLNVIAFGIKNTGYLMYWLLTLSNFTRIYNISKGKLMKNSSLSIHSNTNLKFNRTSEMEKFFQMIQ